MEPLIWHKISTELKTYWRSQDDFSEAIEKPKSNISSLINWRIVITPERAKLIGDFFSIISNGNSIITPEYLLEEQSKIDLQKIAESQSSSDMKTRAFAIENYPVKELRKRWYISNKMSELVSSLQQLFWINNIEHTDEIFPLLNLNRQSNVWLINKNNMKVWLKLALKQSREQNHINYDKELLLKIINNANEYSFDGNIGAENFLRDISSCWLKVVVLEHFEKTRIDWATFWDDKFKCPVLIMSIRYDRLDNFWFTLMHELWHVILHEDDLKDSPFIEDWNLTQKETEANSFASEKLIKCVDWNSMRYSLYDEDIVINFSNTYKVHPSIVVWRLKHERILGWHQLSKLSSVKIDKLAYESYQGK